MDTQYNKVKLVPSKTDETRGFAYHVTIIPHIYYICKWLYSLVQLQDMFCYVSSGVFTDVMDCVDRKKDSSFILQYDGKLLRDAISHNSGDADYMGVKVILMT